MFEIFDYLLCALVEPLEDFLAVWIKTIDIVKKGCVMSNTFDCVHE
jgi:hypothetical protein